MFRFLKGLMKGGEPAAAPATIPVDDLPGWIRDEQEKVREDLSTLVAAHRKRITGEIGRMQEVLAGFDTASMEEVTHRKLAQVTEKSLPLFLKAMKTSLSRDLPGDPEGFYTATGEVLKGCLSAFRGQGRYLSTRFPAEMKALRDGLDAIGKEANAMTPGIGRARERLGALGELGGALGAYRDVKGRAALAGEETCSVGEEAAKAGASLESVRHALAELRKGGEFQACEQELARIRGLEEERERVVRLYRGTAATAIHLMGKGERIASRKKDREAARFLHEALALLDGDLPLPGDTAEGILTRGQGVLAAFASSGDLVPKNREEEDLLGGQGRLAPQVQELSRRFSALSGEISSAREAAGSRPALAKSRELEAEAEALGKRIGRAEERLEQLGAGSADLEGRVHASFRDLQEKVAALSGGALRVSEPAG